MEQQRVDWEKAQEFSEGEVTVIVHRLPLRFPRFAIEVGSSFKDKEGFQKIGRRIPVKTEGRGTLTLASKAEVLVRLFAQAEAWALQQAQAAEPQKQDRPNPKGSNPQKSGPQLGLKEMRKRDKAAWEAKKATAEAKPEPTP